MGASTTTIGDNNFPSKNTARTKTSFEIDGWRQRGELVSVPVTPARARVCVRIFGASAACARLDYCEIVNESVRPGRRLDTQCELTENNNCVLRWSGGPPRRVSHRFISGVRLFNIVTQLVRIILLRRSAVYGRVCTTHRDAASIVSDRWISSPASSGTN